ncbi:ribosome hibernation-promoting factor, HPF/YfiA family [Allofustis seminis]|uniref:ribosome hibernation-promoting factor, HPF/YfiA family n=1 Tax=Allofustis seminis TaxID=166939 RepID=UPI000367EBBA|nr:ribosome-associated translation inhibitor RaiA [Allofustis seminis]
MLNYNIRGENIEVTPAIRNYTENKIGKIEKYFEDEPNASAHVNLKTYSDHTAKVEVTVPLPHVVLRAEETTEDLYGSIDLVADKLERQIRKYKTKVNRKFRRQHVDELQPIDPDLWGGEEEHEEHSSKIVKTKRFNLKPMSPEEAVLQMEMLGHNFFIFRDAETDSKNIVYKRDDGDYGLIETDEE